MNIVLIRDYAGDDCTLGRLTVAVDGAIFEALERPWVADPTCIGGHPDLSCVPAGTYQLALHDSPKFPKHFALVNHALGVYHMPADVPSGVLARTACLLHSANFVDQLEGCCALGRSRRHIAERWMITDSQAAYGTFAGIVPWIEGHTLAISYAPGITPA